MHTDAYLSAKRMYEDGRPVPPWFFTCPELDTFQSFWYAIGKELWTNRYYLEGDTPQESIERAIETYSIPSEKVFFFRRLMRKISNLLRENLVQEMKRGQ